MVVVWPDGVPLVFSEAVSFFVAVVDIMSIFAMAAIATLCAIGVLGVIVAICVVLCHCRARED